jgi:hypothetical protein
LPATDRQALEEPIPEDAEDFTSFTVQAFGKCTVVNF